MRGSYYLSLTANEADLYQNSRQGWEEVLGRFPNAAVDVDRKRLFNQMLAWGLSMCVVGAVVCYVFFGLMMKSA